MYGYEPLHIHGEISMFLTLSSKTVLVNNTCILWIPKTKPVFFKKKTLLYFSKNKNYFMKNSSKPRVCVCKIYLSNPPTILSFTFYLKTKSYKNKPRHKSWSWSLHLKSSSPSWLGPNMIHRARLLLSTWCGLDAQALESNRVSSKTWL